MCERGYCMTFIITLIALVIERFFDWSHLRQWRWFTLYQAWLISRFSKWSPIVIFLICLLPPLLIVVCINFLLTGWLFNLIKLIFGATMLVYCLGPNNFWAEVYAAIKILHTEEPQIASEKVRQLFRVNSLDNPQVFHKKFTQMIFVEANRRVFAVFFWFLLLGPVGAMLYRLVDLCKLRGITTQALAAQVQNLLDWLPVRIFTFIFALAGHFTAVIQHWRLCVFSPPIANDVFLTDCGIAALDILESGRIPEDGSAEKETLALLDRAFVIALVILAIVVLVI